MIKKLVASISGSVGMFNKAEAIAGIGSICNKQTDKINEMIAVINKQQEEIEKLKLK